MTIAEFNDLDESQKREMLFNCCGSNVWVNKMLQVFPVENLTELLHEANQKWRECSEKDFLEAFSHHPKIGDKNSIKQKFAATAAWVSNEQAGVNQADDLIIDALAKGNEDYESKFGFIFIVYATGKSAKQMLDLLTLRLPNNREKEIKFAAAEQQKITTIRLQKLFA